MITCHFQLSLDFLLLFSSFLVHFGPLIVGLGLLILLMNHFQPISVNMENESGTQGTGGGEEHDANSSVPAGDWATGRGRQGGRWT